MNIGFISLGCSKNLVDTEMMIGYYKKEGYTIVSDVSAADMIVINTCGFIESAKQEAIDTILEMAEYKKKKCKKLVVTGCLVERYLLELEDELPEVDLFIPIRDYDKIFERLDYHNRIITTGKNYAYLRIADGCSNNCTYCAIPKIRGPFKSREFNDILKEAKELHQKGYNEIILVAQDTSRYGIDLYNASRIAELLEEIAKIDFRWIRFLYTYPEMITDELIDVVCRNKNICNYFDIPIQHISNEVLKRMGRKGGTSAIYTAISKIREKIPDAIIRTSLIVGFPGETVKQFNQLNRFVRDVKFDRLGVFTYSMEDGTSAVKLNGHLTEKTKKRRFDKIMETQQNVSTQLNKMLIGKKYECVIDGVTEDGKYYIGRSYMNVPDVDGVIFVKKEAPHKVGDIIHACVCSAVEYDLIADEI